MKVMPMMDQTIVLKVLNELMMPLKSTTKKVLHQVLLMHLEQLSMKMVRSRVRMMMLPSC
jgi:hypothetical protein